MVAKFVKYNSIENVTNREVYKFKNGNLYNPVDMWNVTPKVDGSNFAIYFDENGNIIPARRKDTLTMNSNFFNFQKIFDKYGKNAFVDMHNSILEHYGDCEGYKIQDVSFHGELCGGSYPNTDTIPNVKRIQKRVYYSNDTEFAMFDIRLWVGENKYYYMPHRHLVRYCNAYGIPSVPILFEGNLEECLIWSQENKFDIDPMWKIFGMANPVEGNIREGHVIKPSYKTLFNADSRIIFKDKNKGFDEGDDSKVKKVKIKIEYSDELMNVLGFVDNYINYNRFCSVTSKFGEYTIKDFGNLMNLMVEDVEEELSKSEHWEVLTEVDKSELHKILIKSVSREFVNNKKEWF